MSPPATSVSPPHAHDACRVQKSRDPDAPDIERRRGIILANLGDHDLLDESVAVALRRMCQTPLGLHENEGIAAARRLIAELRTAIQEATAGLPACFDAEAYWRHSVATASAAALLAESRDTSPDAAPAFVAGLLHDLGKLALVAHYPKAYERVRHAAHRTSRSMSDLERDALGVDHALVARRILETHALPKGVQDAVWLHHRPPRDLRPDLPERRLAWIVALANVIAHRAGFAGVAGSLSGDLASRAALSGFDDDAIRQVVASLPALTDRLAGPVESATHPCAAAMLAGGQPDHSPIQRILDDLRQLPPRCLHVETVNRTLAKAFAEAFSLTHCATFAAEAGSERVVAALYTRETDTFRTAEYLAPRSTPSGRESEADLLGPMPERFAALTERLTCEWRCAEPRMLVLGRGPWFRGGVVFPGEASIAECEPEWECLSHAGALALEAALARRRALAAEEAAMRDGGCATEGAGQDPGPTSIGALARMAAGAAHELNNPLAVISGRIQLLSESNLDTEVRRQIEVIGAQAHRASDIVSELLAFAHPDAPKPRLVNLQSWAWGFKQHWHRRSPLAAHQIEVRISDARLVGFVDPAQLDEAADAVLANALEANTPDAARLIINSPSAPSDDTLVVSFGDNGRGMPPDVLAHALDPFFSHRPAGRGRGLGLSRAARLLEVNDGRLWLESSPNAGTTVFFALPARRGGC